MKKPALLFTALAFSSIVLLFLWRLLEAPERGTRPVATPESSAATPESPAPAAIASPEPAAALPATEPAPSTQASEVTERTASASGGGRTLRGEVLLPPEAPADDSLRVLAFAENLAPREIYGTGGVLDDLAAGKRTDKLLATAPVEGPGRFTLPLAAEATVWLALDGRFLYSSRALAVPPDEESVRLEATLGALVTGLVRLPAGVGEPAKALEELELSLQPDTDDFSLGSADLPLRRRAEVDSDGRFELRAVQPGHPHELEVDSDVCADTTQGGIQLAAGETRELALELTLGATVRGTVRDEGGKPVGAAEVRAAEPGFWGFPGEELVETTSAADGSFALEHVRAGKVLLLAKAGGYLEPKALELELQDAQERPGVELVLETGASIAGRALFPDGTPAAGATIEVGFDPAAMVGMGAMNAARGAEGKATAAADGTFVVSGLGKGPFRVAGKLDRDPGPGEDEWRGRVAGVAAGADAVALELGAPATLTGRVVDLAGAPVRKGRARAELPGAVFFEPATTREESFENDAGEFRLAGLDAGKWTVSASAEGFGPSAGLEVVVPRETPEPLVISLAPAASLAGTVVDPQGASISGAKVALHTDTAQRLQRLRGDRDQPEAISIEDGSFVLEGLAAGRTSVEARCEGFASSDPVDVELRAGETTTGIVLRLRKGGVVTGEVYGKEGEPAAGVRVIAQSPGGLDMSMKTADGEGRFRLENLDPGSWTITALLGTGGVDPEGEADDAATSMFENLRFTMVQLDEGEEEHVVLGAPPKDPVLVRGRVRHGGDPVKDGMVSFFAEGSKGLEALKIAPLGADGDYEARLDEPGKYVVTVQVTGGAGAFQQHTIEFRENVPEVEEHRLDLALPLGGVRGRVSGADRAPLASARVSLVTEGGIELGSMMGGQYSEAVTDAEGRYAFDYLRPGRYAVAAGGALFGGAFGNETQAGRAIRAGLAVEEGRMLEGIDFQLDEPGSLGGKVVDAAGVPVKDVSLFVRDASGRLMDRFSMITTSSDGTYDYKGLAPGEYVITARGKGLASTDSAPVRVEAGVRASVDLVLHPGTKLVVEVVDDEGRTADVRVSVTDPNGREVHGMLGWAEMSALFADGFDSAQQVVGPLPPGTYTIVAIANDGKKTTRSVTLDGQAERRLKLRLR